MTTARALLAKAGATAVRGRALCATTAGVDLIGRAVVTTVATTSGHTVAVIVYDRSLADIAQTAGNDLPRLDPAGLQRARRWHAQRARRSSPAPAARISSSSASRSAAGWPAATSAASPSCRRRWPRWRRVLGDEVALLAAGSAVALLLALLAGVLLTSRALRPLQRLTTTAQQLAAGDLRARSGVESRHDEIGTLARSFDDMAARIEQSFAAQQASEERTRRFIADASHELRTPITALKGYIDVIRRGATPEPQALDAALDAMAQGGRAHARPGARPAHPGAPRRPAVDQRRGDRPRRRGRPPPRRGRARHAADAATASCSPTFWPSSTATRWPRSSATCWSTPASTRRVRPSAGAPTPTAAAPTSRRATRARASPPPTSPTSSSASTAARRRVRARRGQRARPEHRARPGRANQGDVDIDSTEGAGTTVTVWFPRAAPAGDDDRAAAATTAAAAATVRG